MNARATTAALTTAPARGGIAVIGLAGPGTARVLGSIFRPGGAGPSPGRLALGLIADGEEVLDEAIVSMGDSGVAEINIHGGPHVARKVLTLLAGLGVEIASNARLDPALTAAAGRAGRNPAIAAEMPAALRRAATPLAASAVTAQWTGGLSALASAGRPDAKALRAAAGALPLMTRLLAPAEVVIAGPPNAGKSALANALVARQVCIVSGAPGTTRDWVRTPTDADGVPIWLTDTAGLWEDPTAPDEIERQAVRRAWQRIDQADLVICLTAGDGPGGEIVDRLLALPDVIRAAGKCDAAAADASADVAVSGVTFDGIADLRAAIRDRLGFGGFDPAAPMAFTQRQADLLTAAAAALDSGRRAEASRMLDLLLSR